MIMIERRAKVNNNNNNIMRTKIQRYRYKDTNAKLYIQVTARGGWARAVSIPERKHHLKLMEMYCTHTHTLTHTKTVAQQMKFK